MKTKIVRLIIGATAFLSLIATTNFAQAAALTSAQVYAIVNLLQTFGADPATITSVQATLSGQPTSGIATTQTTTQTSNQTQPSAPVQPSSSCVDLFANVSVGSSGNAVTQLQQFLGVSATGYFGNQTKLAVMNWQQAHGISPIGTVGPATRAAMGCGSSISNTQPATVSGMTKYTDNNYGFSFWYPSGWQVSTVQVDSSQLGYASADKSYIEGLQVSNGTKKILIARVSMSPSGIVDVCGKCADKIYFDKNLHTWMYYQGYSLSQGLANPTTKPADVSVNTMGGLHIINNAVIPLSASTFVIVEDGNFNNPAIEPLANTIVATDPSVATPVSTAQQTATIGAEAAAYGVTNSSTAVNTQTYTDSQYNFTVNYDPKLLKTTVDQVGYMGKPIYSNTLLTLFYSSGDSVTFRADKNTNYEDCLRNNSTSGVTSVQINGQTFYKSTGGDVALGHSLSTKTYRTYYNGACYSIHIWIESDRNSSGSGYSDISAQTNALQKVLDTFKFTVSETSPIVHETTQPAWKTFNGQYMPVSFSYPGNYFVTETTDDGYGNQIDINPGSKVGLDFVANGSFKSNIEIQKSIVNPNDTVGTLQKSMDFDATNQRNYYGPITIGGIQGYVGGLTNLQNSFGSNASNTATVHFQKGNYLYRILLDGPISTDTFNTFMTSFKFKN